ncbi:glycosyl hydrolase family 61-domain-containing protein [Bombardia bombarda]|uniref:lytic cellulose monooxygenase (C4-dehydrogenating) n=1 Tax=Bombardia bombarda TaxID=252184 RepID=A0AA39X6S3_9PEZI|nr:glycosyl hydrolase family 61-domain-containing protein [Bombardia bombarda]
MRSFVGVAALSLAVSNVSAHYIFQQLTVGSTKNAVFKYIRQNTNYNSPVTDLTSNDLRCNVGGGSGASTETVAVKAGDSFTFTLDTAVYHQGPVSVYMSKAPSTAASYDGSGAWFKVLDIGPTFSGSSATWPMADSYTFKIPACIANGEYLLRIQQLAIHNPWPAGIPQFYISCAQISVSGGGSTTPSQTALIPGAFKDTDPGYTVNIYSGFTSYTVPGPAVFSCGASGGTSPAPVTSSATPVTSSAAPVTTSKPATTLATTTKAATTTSSTTPSGCSLAKYAQCGGSGWTGCTACASGSTCSKSNDYYSQCL